MKLIFCMRISIKALQIDTMILMRMIKFSQSYQNSKFAMSLQYLKKEFNLWDEVNFCMQINIKIPYKLIATLWASKFPTRWYYHYWWAWSRILKVLSVTSLQYLYNILKKEVRNGANLFLADKHWSSYKLALSILMEVPRHTKGSQNRQAVIFLNYVKKKVLHLLLCSMVMQNFQIFREGPVEFFVNFKWCPLGWGYEENFSLWSPKITLNCSFYLFTGKHQIFILYQNFYKTWLF